MSPRGQPRVLRLVVPPLALGALTVGAAVWAFQPLGDPAGDTPAEAPRIEQSSPERSAGEVRLVALDRSAFSTPLWIAPPAPPPPPAAPAKPAPLKIQLIAIIKDSAAGNSVRRAMLYDIDADKVIIVAAGEKVGAGSVESVEENLLRLRGADGVRTLTLKADGSTK